MTDLRHFTIYGDDVELLCYRCFWMAPQHAMKTGDLAELVAAAEAHRCERVVEGSVEERQTRRALPPASPPDRPIA